MHIFLFPLMKPLWIFVSLVRFSTEGMKGNFGVCSLSLSLLGIILFQNLVSKSKAMREEKKKKQKTKKYSRTVRHRTRYLRPSFLTLINFYWSVFVVDDHSLSRVQLFSTPCTAARRFLCPPLSPGVCSNILVPLQCGGLLNTNLSFLDSICIVLCVCIHIYTYTSIYKCAYIINTYINVFCSLKK